VHDHGQVALILILHTPSFHAESATSLANGSGAVGIMLIDENLALGAVDHVQTCRSLPVCVGCAVGKVPIEDA